MDAESVNQAFSLTVMDCVLNVLLVPIPHLMVLHVVMSADVVVKPISVVLIASFV